MLLLKISAFVWIEYIKKFKNDKYILKIKLENQSPLTKCIRSNGSLNFF